MNDNQRTTNYGNAVHEVRGVTCVTHSDVPVGLVEHLLDLGMTALQVCYLIPNASFVALIKIACQYRPGSVDAA